MSQFSRDADELSVARKLLVTAPHALRSYQYGNGSPDLAEDVSQAISDFLVKPFGETE